MRNKTLEIFFCCSLTLFLHVPAEALFTLSLNQSLIDFGPLSLGTESSIETIISTVRSDINMEWTLMLNASLLTHTDSVTTFPQNGFRYGFTSDNAGTEIPSFPLDAPIPSSPTTIYTSDSSEYTVDPGNYEIGIKAVVSQLQKAGSYSSQLVFTLVNNF